MKMFYTTLNDQQADYIKSYYPEVILLEPEGENKWYLELEENDLKMLIDWLSEEIYLLEEEYKEDGKNFEDDPDGIFLNNLFKTVANAKEF